MTGKTQETMADSMGVLARGTALNFAGTGFQVLGRVIFSLLVARLLGPSLLGVYLLAVIIGDILAAIALGGADMLLPHNIGRYRAAGDWAGVRGTIRFAAGFVTAAGLTLAVALLVGAPWIAQHLFGKPEMILPLRMVALIVPIDALLRTGLWATMSFKQMKYRFYIDSLLNPFLKIGLTVLFYLLGWGIFGFLLAYGISLLLCALLAWRGLRRCLPAGYTSVAPRYEWKRWLNYAYPVVAATALNLLMRGADTLVLAHYRPMAEVGLYALCIRLMMISGFVLPVLSPIFAPFVSELHHQQNYEKLEPMFKTVTLWAAQFYLPILLFFVVAPSQVLALFGNEFRAAAACLVILAVGQSANVLSGPVGMVLNMTGWTRLQMWNTAAVLGLQVIFSFLLIPRFGILGAATAHVATVISINAVRVWQAHRRLGLHPFSVLLAKPASAALVALLTALPFWFASTPLTPPRVALLWTAMLFAYAGMLTTFGLDHHSRLAWYNLRDSISARFRREPATNFTWGKETS